MHIYLYHLYLIYVYTYLSSHGYIQTFFIDSCLIQGTNDWFDSKPPSLSFCYSLINVPQYLGSIRNCARPTKNKRVSFLQLKCPQWEILGAKRIRSEVSTNFVQLCCCFLGSQVRPPVNEECVSNEKP